MKRIANTRMVGAFLFAVVLLSAQLAIAFPGPAMPIHESWLESDLVVFADVVSVTRQHAQQRAALTIAKVIKGDASKNLSNIVVFNQLGGCPYPHYFEPNERVIVFLRYDAEQLMYTTVAAAESVIVTDAEGMARFVAFLNRLQPIFDERDKTKRQEKLLRWSIDCALDPITRSEGLRSISWTKRRGVPTTQWMDDKDKNAFVETIVTESPPQKSLVGVLELLVDCPSPKLDTYLLSSLKRCSNENWRPIARFALTRLPKRLGITLEQGVELKLKQYRELESDLGWGSDGESSQRKSKGRISLHVQFGLICGLVYRQCADAIKKMNRQTSPVAR